MNHGSLFSGGGGFDLAAASLGWRNVFHCEKDRFCQTILKHYWPNATPYTDIKEFNAKPYKGKIDIIIGGFPCQPFSTAGKRKGTADDRYLWPDMLRIIREVQPRWVVCENVYGLINWNEGLVFDQVLSDLEAEGYEVAVYVLPAAGICAPHQRYRVWIVAYHSQYATQGQKKDDTYPDCTGRLIAEPGRKIAVGRNTRKCQHTVSLCEAQLEKAGAHPNGDGLQRRDGKNEKQPGKTRQHAQSHFKPLGKSNAGRQWRNWPTQPPLCGGDDGLPAQLDGIAIPKWTRQSIKMYGNSVLPQLALQLFKAIALFEG